MLLPEDHILAVFSSANNRRSVFRWKTPNVSILRVTDDPRKLNYFSLGKNQKNATVTTGFANLKTF